MTFPIKPIVAHLGVYSNGTVGRHLRSARFCAEDRVVVVARGELWQDVDQLVSKIEAWEGIMNDDPGPKETEEAWGLIIEAAQIAKRIRGQIRGDA